MNTMKTPTQAPALPPTLKELLRTQLIDLIQTQSVSGNCYMMHNKVTRTLSTLGIPYHVDLAGNIIATKGVLDSGMYYPGICAHLDTVHNIVPEEDYHVYHYKNTFGDELYGSTTGIGGDDKCGIALLLMALAHVDMPMKAFFFVDEEIGCVGSEALNPMETVDVGYLIQPDRKGSSDVIADYFGADTVSKRFRKAMRPVMRAYKYSETTGLFTDVFSVQESAKVSAINFSCGYYEPHSHTEYIVFDDLFRAQCFMFDLLNALGTNRYQCFAQKRWSKSTYGGSMGRQPEPYEYDYDVYDRPGRFDSSYAGNSSVNGSVYTKYGLEPATEDPYDPYEEVEFKEKAEAEAGTKSPTKQEMIDEYRELFGEDPVETDTVLDDKVLDDKDIEYLR